MFRKYSITDLGAVVDIFRSNIPKYFGPNEEAGLIEFLSEYHQDYYVLETDSEIVAAGGIAQNDDGTVSLCWGMVRGDHIGTGLGKQLTEVRIAASRERFGDVPLVISTSQLTRGFYEKFGFRLTEHTPDGFGPGIDICKMRRDAVGRDNGPS